MHFSALRRAPNNTKSSACSKLLTAALIPIRTSALPIDAPFDGATTGYIEENKAVESGQFALINRREKLGSYLKFPVKLEIGHGHRAAGQESRPSRLKSQHYGQTTDQLNDAAKPNL